MRTAALSFVFALAACGGETAPPAPAPEPIAEPAPEPAPEPVAEPAPAADPAPDLAAMTEADRHAWLMTTGEAVYNTGGTGGIACKTCHMDAGQGAPPAFPPLAASDALGDCAKHAGYVVHGLSGEITVNGTTYNGIMPAQANLSDHEIAAVITYERNSWGNAAGDCMPSDVAGVRP